MADKKISGLESTEQINDTDVFAVVQNNYTKKLKWQTMINKIKNVLNPYNMGLGTNISANTNLNNLISVGSYYSENATKTSTLINAPINNAGFRLNVEYLSSINRIRQTIIVNADIPIVYVRTYTGAWNNWDKLITSSEIKNTNTIGSYYTAEISNSTSFTITIPSNYLNYKNTTTIKNIFVVTGDSGAFIVNFSKDNITNFQNCVIRNINCTKDITATGNGTNGIDLVFSDTIYGGIKCEIMS